MNQSIKQRNILEFKYFEIWEYCINWPKESTKGAKILLKSQDIKPKQDLPSKYFIQKNNNKKQKP